MPFSRPKVKKCIEYLVCSSKCVLCFDFMLPVLYSQTEKDLLKEDARKEFSYSMRTKWNLTQYLE